MVYGCCSLLVYKAQKQVHVYMETDVETSVTLRIALQTASVAAYTQYLNYY